MKFTQSFAFALSLVRAISARSLQQGSTAFNYTSSSAAGAIYFLANQVEGNFIISSEINPDGTLTYREAISTGGKGQHGNSTGPDALFSQGSVQVAGSRVFAVNPGSDSVAVFEIDKNNPTHLKMIGQPVSSGGEFPISVAVSKQTGQVCVLNGGKINGVSCYRQDVVIGLVPIKDTQRSLNLDLLTPPSGPANSVSQVLFSDDGSLLFATVKGSPAEPGFIASWDVNRFTGALSEHFIRSTPAAGGGLPFGMTLIPKTSAVIVTDPGSGFEVFDFKNLTSIGAPSTVTPVSGEQAVCWVAFSEKTGNFYMTDIGTSLVTEVHVNSDLQSTIVKQYPQGEGASILDDTIATVRGNDFLYVLAAGTKSISVISLQGAGDATPLQQYDLEYQIQDVVTDFDFDNLQGLAVYVSH